MFVGGRSSSWEEGKEISCLSGKEYNVEKRERGRDIIFPIILRLLEEYQVGERGRDEKFEKEIQD